MGLVVKQALMNMPGCHCITSQCLERITVEASPPSTTAIALNREHVTRAKARSQPLGSRGKDGNCNHAAQTVLESLAGMKPSQTH